MVAEDGQLGGPTEKIDGKTATKRGKNTTLDQENPVGKHHNITRHELDMNLSGSPHQEAYRTPQNPPEIRDEREKVSNTISEKLSENFALNGHSHNPRLALLHSISRGEKKHSWNEKTAAHDTKKTERIDVLMTANGVDEDDSEQKIWLQELQNKEMNGALKDTKSLTKEERFRYLRALRDKHLKQYESLSNGKETLEDLQLQFDVKALLSAKTTKHASEHREDKGLSRRVIPWTPVTWLGGALASQWYALFDQVTALIKCELSPSTAYCYILCTGVANAKHSPNLKN